MVDILLLKQLHITLAATSIIFFIVRFLGRQMEARFVQSKWVRPAPHLIDTLLLASGISLAVLYRLSPLQAHWLMVKLILILGYIGAGIGAMKAADATHRMLYGLLALCLVGGVVLMAVLKPLPRPIVANQLKNVLQSQALAMDEHPLKAISIRRKSRGRSPASSCRIR
ncbi:MULTISPECIES: SirB2 family protein [unclassified Microbulbifer]|uniref:SirB2 family protein n=1 Tax=unclassified Microbulbifer TaxID=2619833 RepID=UPI0027E51966|nr:MULTISPECIES: SirB2 family protein [unclassified Microbulbifer]